MKSNLRFALSFVLLFSTVFLMAQSTVSGVISDSDGSPLEGATVLIKETGEGTITDEQGAFSILALADQTLVVSYVGLATQEISVGSSSNFTIVMETDAAAFSEVVVTATRQPVRKIQTTTAINSIGAEELQANQPESFGEAIQYTPGVTVENSQGRKSAFNIRGFPGGNTYVTSLMDGLPLSGFASRSGSVAEFHGLDKNVERIEVVRGSGATLFGRAAAAGAVNIITKTGGEELGGNISFTRFNNVMGEGHPNDGDLDYRVDLNVNGPITDKLRFNVGGYIMNDSGYKEWAQKDKGTQFRGNIDYIISPTSKIRVYGMYGNNQFNNLTDSPFNIGTGELAEGWGNHNTYYPDNTQLDFPSILYSSVFAPIQFSSKLLDSEGREIVQNQAEDNREEVIGGHVGISADIDLGGGFSISEKFRIQGFGWRDQNEVTFSSFYTAQSSILRLNANSNGNVDDLINETRLQYTVDGENSVHNLSLGFYYSDAKYDRLGGLHWYTANVNPRPTYGWFGPPGTPPQTRFSLSSTTSHQEESVTSFFAGDEMVFNDKLSINAGIRYDVMKGSFNNDPLEVDGIDYNPAEVEQNDLEFSDWSGSIGANYLITERSAIYASVLRAFSLPSVGLATPVPEKNEIVINTEVGYRTGLGDLGIDIGFYNTVINNRLASVFDPSATTGQTFVVKPVGKNIVRGSELQLTYAPSAVKGLLIRGALTLQSSEFDGFQIALDKFDHDGDPMTPTIVEADINNLFGLDLVTIDAADDLYAIDVTGNKVHNTPDLITSFNVGYRGKSFGAGIDMVHFSGRYVTSLNLLQAPDLTILNANAYYQMTLNGDSRLRLGIRIKNLLDGARPQQLVLGSTSDDILIQKQKTPDFTDVLGFGISQIPRRLLITLGYDF